jgi:Protein of unknown function (DUF4019)
MRKRALSILAIVTLASLTGSCSKDKTTAAQQAAEAWLKIVDSGNYGQSWDESATLMKTTVAKDQWEQILTVNRAPLGARISRKLTSAEYKNELPGAPAGQYVVLEYTSTFAHKDAVVETAAPTLDKDGTWRVSLYYIK